MSQQPDDRHATPPEFEASRSPANRHRAGNGSPSALPSRDTRPVPSLSVPELLEDRNWTALAGLALVGVGMLILLEDALTVHLSLWALLLLGLGGWLAWDGWQRYQRTGAWDSIARNRAFFGGVIALVGLIGLLDLNWWGLLLMVLGARLGQQTWQRYQRQGRVWTAGLRRRALLAMVIGAIGLFSFLHLGSAGPLLLVILGAGLILERAGR